MAVAENPTEWLRQHLKEYVEKPDKPFKNQDDCYAFKKWSQAILEQWSKDVGKVENLPISSREIAATFQDYAVKTVLDKAKRMPTHYRRDGDKAGAIVGYMLWFLKAMRDTFDDWLPNGFTAMGSTDRESLAVGTTGEAETIVSGNKGANIGDSGMAMGATLMHGPFGGGPTVDIEAICKEALGETMGTTLGRWVGTAEDIYGLTKRISAEKMNEWAIQALKLLSDDSLTAVATRDGESMAHYLTRTGERMRHIDEKGSDPEKPFKNWIVAQLQSMASHSSVSTVTATWMQNGNSPEGSQYKAWIALENLNTDMGKISDEMVESNLSGLLEIHYQGMSAGFDKWLGEYRDFLREIRKSFEAKESFRKNYARWNYSVEWSTPRDDKIADYKKTLTEANKALEKLGAKTIEGFKHGKKKGVVTEDQVASISNMFEKTKPLFQEGINAVEGKK